MDFFGAPEVLSQAMRFFAYENSVFQIPVKQGPRIRFVLQYRFILPIYFMFDGIYANKTNKTFFPSCLVVFVSVTHCLHLTGRYDTTA